MITCEVCGSNAVIILVSINQRWCNDCDAKMLHKLKPGQKSILIENEIGTDKSKKYPATKKRKK